MSCMVSAANTPNCCCVKSSAVPIKGKTIIAIKFKRKIIAIEEARSSFFDSIIGANAAIAVPPHIAVPAINKSKCFLLIFIQ